MYVLFELGARWGSDRHLLPLLANGISSGILKGPLSELNALSCDNASQLHQLVEDIARILEIKPEKAHAYQRYIDEIRAIPPGDDKMSSGDDQVEATSECKLTDVQLRIVKQVALLSRGQAEVGVIANLLGLSQIEAQYNLDELTRTHKLLDWIGNMDPDVPTYYVMTHGGRGFVLSLEAS